VATHEPVGSLAEEAAKLFSALQGWAADHRAASDGASGAATSARASGSSADAARDHAAGDGAAGDDAAGDGAAGDGAAGDGAAGDEAARYADEHAAGQHLSVECRYCPLCNVARFARAASPEVREHLTSAALSMTLAVKGLLEGIDRGDRPESRREPVEKIDLLED
jgi:hypothetical protein